MVNMIEMVIGAVLIGVGLIYLTSQYKAADRLISAASSGLLDEAGLYQQYNEVNLNLISDEELYTIVMGYREYPIVIDGIVIGQDGNDYNYYFTLIKDDYYRKSYSYDASHKVVQVIFTFAEPI